LISALPKIVNVSTHFPASEKSSTRVDELNILIGDCIAHSRSAQKKLYDLYAPEVYGIIKKYVYNNDSVAKEILNDSFFKIFRDLGQYSFQGAFEGWIRRIVVNEALTYLRRNRSMYLETDLEAADREPDYKMLFSFRRLHGV